jgi:hypothetical protein
MLPSHCALPGRESQSAKCLRGLNCSHLEGDISGKLRLIYGSGPADPAPFVLTLTSDGVNRGRASHGRNLAPRTPPTSWRAIGSERSGAPSLSSFDRAKPLGYDAEIIKTLSDTHCCF